MQDDKARARKAAFARRKAARDATGPAPGTDLAGLIADGPVAGYMPIRTEIDPRPVLEILAARGLTLCLPVVTGPAQPLTFRRWAPGEALEEGAFGALIPAAREEIEPRTLIVPMLAFDRRLYRLGYGGGFYDRTLQRLRAAGPTFAIGLAYAAQECEGLPVEPTDQPLDLIVTEAEVIRPAT